MTDPLFILILSAATLGVVHTAIGVDHSLPLVVFARTRGWALRGTLLVTLGCGLAHVLSSVAIAAVGLGLGVAGGRLLAIEETRGTWAAWCLVGFGLAYAAVGLWKAWARPHVAAHGGYRHLVPGLVFVFALGPCEALLPLLTASGMALSFSQALLVTVVFSLSTVLTMLVLVTVGFVGASFSSVQRKFAALERYSHVLAGLTLALSGVTIRVLGV